MNSQIQTQIFTLVFVLFIVSTFNPITLFIHISIYTMLSKINKSPSKVSIPCSYISSKMTKTSAVLKSVIKKTNAVSTQPIAIVELTSTQKEAALPFLTQEPKKQKSLKSKVIKIVDSR